MFLCHFATRWLFTIDLNARNYPFVKRTGKKYRYVRKCAAEFYGDWDYGQPCLRYHSAHYAGIDKFVLTLEQCRVYKGVE